MTTGAAAPGPRGASGTNGTSAPGGTDPVAAITEREAQGEVAAYYADIRETLGVPVVNLVWRHLATFEGALPWAWQAVRPVYVSGAVAQAADHLRAQMQLSALPTVPAAVLSSLGLSTSDLNGIRAVLRSYERSNPMNWLALSALLRAAQPRADRPTGSVDALAGDRPDEDARAQSSSDLPGDNGSPNIAPPLAVLPPLPALATLDAQTARLVLRLDALGNDHPRAILASMYRHLSYWPAYLAMLWLQLADRGPPNRVALARDAVTRCGEPLIRSLTERLRQSPATASAPAQGLSALRDFMDRIGLPRMIAITSLAQASLSSTADCRQSESPSATP